MNTATNIVAVVILVLLVGFGVWYFTARESVPEDSSEASLEVNLGGTGSEGGN